MAKRQREVLSAQDYDMITQALRGLDNVPDVIQRAEACGVDCKEYSRMLDYSRDALQQILDTWFPKGRPR